MSVLKIPLVKRGITFNEVPDRMSVYFELGDCTKHCEDCHSKELWAFSKSDYVNINDLIRYAADQIEAGANAIVVLGGTTACTLTEEDMVDILNSLSMIAPVCLYSGSDDIDRDKLIAVKGNCSWLKTGSYKKYLGGLESKNTNQRFYRVEGTYSLDVYDTVIDTDVKFIDETYKFRRKGINKIV